MKGSVLVIGGGIAGIQASLDLADMGFHVYLLERGPSIGGVMAQLDKTFPTNDCSMCIEAPKMVEVSRHPNITILTYVEIEEVKGDAGNFIVKIRKKPKYVDESKCRGCIDDCGGICPIVVPSEYNALIGGRKAIYIPFPQSVPMIACIDAENCVGCRLCELACEPRAIDYFQFEKEEELEVGAIVVATGFTPFDASKKDEYGFDLYDDVITNLQYERILSASGPTGGRILRPSDGKPPRKIAWIQCVGSRDLSANPYCSSVCCMAATKEAILTKERDKDIETYIFYIDIRAYGKGFQHFYDVGKKIGIKYINSIPGEIYRDSEGLILKYEDRGEIIELKVDLVVLSAGISPSETNKKLSEVLGLEIDDNGFLRVKDQLLAPVETNKPGIFVCGCAQSPKDIPDSIIQASGASAKAAALLSRSRRRKFKKSRTTERMVSPIDRPRIGVFVCRCGINIGSVIDVPSVVEYAKTLPNVVFAEEQIFSCSEDSQKRMREVIREKNLNRVIIAACTPRTHEPLFRETCMQAGLNPYLFEMANIREHCSWVHVGDRKKATEKACDLIRMAVARSEKLFPIHPQKIGVRSDAIVVGGGISGMRAALDIADGGFSVYIIEKEKELGGLLRYIDELQDGRKAKGVLKEFVERVKKHPRIKVITGAEVKEISGHVGDFCAKILRDSEEMILKFGVAVIATGATEFKPEGYYGYGEDERVITQMELESLLEGDLDAKTVVMIQCVGAREEPRNYCSRICCIEAIKNAIRIKKKNPNCDVFILHRDIQTYGIWENLYLEAGRNGVMFVRYHEDARPVVHSGTVRVYNVSLGEYMEINADLIVLSTPMVPNNEIGRIFKVPLFEDGFLYEAHLKIRPMDAIVDGIFLCGAVHSPKLIPECISQASGAASRACTILSRDEIEAEGIVCVVEEKKCIGCGRCVDVCGFEAVKLENREVILEGMVLNTKKSKINAAACKGCGSCAVECPVNAITPMHFTFPQIEAMIEAFKA
ncbi:MAG: FAD-dependent oxidoreductase [Candidatus Syntropharchaeia archaeon]